MRDFWWNFVQLRPMLFKFWDSGDFHQVGITNIVLILYH